VLAQAGTRGNWRTVSNRVPINPVHGALLRNGQLLVVAGSGNVATETNFHATAWIQATETFLTQALSRDLFRNGMVTLHEEGRVLMNGGNQYDRSSASHGTPTPPGEWTLHRRRKHGSRVLVSDGNDRSHVRFGVRGVAVSRPGSVRGDRRGILACCLSGDFRSRGGRLPQAHRAHVGR
jgi:hypothetical protein